jgi:hypothetical protein
VALKSGKRAKTCCGIGIATPKKGFEFPNSGSLDQTLPLDRYDVRIFSLTTLIPPERDCDAF